MENTLKCIQKILLRGMSKLDRVCRKNNLKYYMIGGTLLGAVRHKGFIPWDSDMDVVMMRNDYEKLISLDENEFGPDYKIISPKIESDCAITFARLLIKDTTLISKKSQNVRHKEMYIDIFPLDKISGRNTLIERIVEYKLKILKRIILYRGGFVTSKNLKNSIIITIFRLLFAFQRTEKLHKKFNKLSKKWNKKDYNYVAHFSTHYPIKKVIQKVEDFGEGCELLFENEKLIAPINYDNVLKTTFGNYMEIPPLNARRSIDLNEYIFEYKNK